MHCYQIFKLWIFTKQGFDKTTQCLVLTGILSSLRQLQKKQDRMWQNLLAKQWVIFSTPIQTTTRGLGLSLELYCWLRGHAVAPVSQQLMLHWQDNRQSYFAVSWSRHAFIDLKHEFSQMGCKMSPHSLFYSVHPHFWYLSTYRSVLMKKITLNTSSRRCAIVQLHIKFVECLEHVTSWGGHYLKIS